MKSSIIAEIQRTTPGYTAKADAEKALKTVTDAVKAVVESEGSARVPGLGVFTKKRREGRTVRNPRTGETIQTSAKDVITFKQSKPAT